MSCIRFLRRNVWKDSEEMMVFIRHFMMGTAVITVAMLLILAVKKSLRRHISFRWQYHISLLCIVMLVMPLLPAAWLAYAEPAAWMHPGMILPAAGSGEPVMAAGEPAVLAAEMEWLENFAVSVKRLDMRPVVLFLTAVWFAGIAAVLICMYRCRRDLRLMKDSLMPAGTGQLEILLAQCKKELGIHRRILCGTSVLAVTPMTIGFCMPLIVLPSDSLQKLTEDELRYVLLHELMHCKHGDILLNHILCVFQAIYWFHPLVLILSRQMHQERELACDAAVLTHLPAGHTLEYGKTLLQFVRVSSAPAVISLSLNLGGAGEQVRRRLESIAAFRRDSLQQRIKSIGIFLFTSSIVAAQLPVLAALAVTPEREYEFTGAEVVYEDLSSFFDGLDGCFVLYDQDNDRYTIYDKGRSIKRIAPASTYKIYSALIAMDQGIISPEQTGRSWGGKNYSYDSWNRDQDLKSAMSDSVTWYFQGLDRQVGKEALESYYTALSYGNHDVSGAIDEYWMESSLRISAVEQVELLTRFYEDETVFESEHTGAVKETLRLSEKNGAVLSGKTGSGVVNGKGVTGWFIGYVETDGRVFVFAVNVEGNDGVAGSNAAETALSILDAKGIYR